MLHTYTSRFNLHSLFALTLGLGISSAAFAQTPIAISSATSVYNQNFDGIGATGTTYPAGWTGLRLSGTSTMPPDLAPAPTDGSANAGGVYNVGTANTTDRALGTLGSTSTEPAIGAVFTNGTGATITRVNIAGRIEQWRSGSNNTVNEVAAFEYSLDATSLSTGTWTAATALDLTERATATTNAAALNGNLAANSAPISGAITLNWPAGTTMWIRWKDVDNTGSDALIALDDFAISTGTTTLGNRVASRNSAISVFPNPSNDVISIRVNGKGIKVPVTVTDLTGRTVLSGTATADGTFDLRSLPAGSYIVLVKDGADSSSYKIVKQ